MLKAIRFMIIACIVQIFLVGCSGPKIHPYMDLPGPKWFMNWGHEPSRAPIPDVKAVQVLEITHWPDQMTMDEEQYVTLIKYEGRLTREQFEQGRAKWASKYKGYSDMESTTIDGRMSYYYWNNYESKSGEVKSRKMIAMVKYEDATWIVIYYARANRQPESIVQKTVESFHLESKQKFYKRI